ncbi:MAG: hypothetical protein WC346_18090 [Methanogenium sp.]|jgi:sulfur carrier protein ThiS
MKKVDRIKIVIGRFGSDPEKLEISKGATVEEALEEAGITLNSTEKIWVNGEKATRKDILENDDNLLLVSPKQAGF